MSRTDRSRPYWVRLADQPMVTSTPLHDHRFGPCTLPELSATTTSYLATGCRWIHGPALDGSRLDHGAREWQVHRRAANRRDRYRARRELRALRKAATTPGEG